MAQAFSRGDVSQVREKSRMRPIASGVLAEREGLTKHPPTPRRKFRKNLILQQAPLVAVHGQNIQKSDKTFKKIRQTTSQRELQSA
jgi:hypothetical protein